MSDIAISVENLSKAYRIGLKEKIHDTLAQAAFSWLRYPLSNFHRLRRLNTFGSNGNGQDEEDILWALRDVSFEVGRGDVMGIIGRNGAGKSTLLKILSRITDPTDGRVVIRGRVSSLLEVGTGFHPELTGRENVYMNGTILGMTKREIDRKFDEIVDFSGVERFLDTPVKRYSSGMKVRLAFAVAAHLEPEILIIDEVLAVGDAEFQKKCLGKMEDVAESGRTVLFVSHNMDAILQLCGTAILLDSGYNEPRRPAAEAVRRYFDGVESSAYTVPLRDRPRLHSADGIPICTDLAVRSSRGDGPRFPSGDEVLFELELEHLQDHDDLVASVTILNEKGQRVVAFHTLYHSGMSFAGGPSVRLHCRVPALPLTPGRYTVQVGVALKDGELLELVGYAEELNVHFGDVLGTGKIPSYRQGHVVLPAEWSRSDTGVPSLSERATPAFP